MTCTKATAGILRYMAMDTLRPDKDRAIFRNAAERLEQLESAIQKIDAVGVDFGHFENAARTMQEIARKATS